MNENELNRATRCYLDGHGPAMRRHMSSGSIYGLRSICRFCHRMIRVDTSRGARWVTDEFIIEEEPV